MADETINSSSTTANNGTVNRLFVKNGESTIEYVPSIQVTNNDGSTEYKPIKDIISNINNSIGGSSLSDEDKNLLEILKTNLTKIVCNDGLISQDAETFSFNTSIMIPDGQIIPSPLSIPLVKTTIQAPPFGYAGLMSPSDKEKLDSLSSGSSSGGGSDITDEYVNNISLVGGLSSEGYRLTLDNRNTNQEIGDEVNIPIVSNTDCGLMPPEYKGIIDGLTESNSSNLTPATASALGGVKLYNDAKLTGAVQPNLNTEKRTYGIQFNNDNQLVVNVPWKEYDLKEYVTKNALNNYVTKEEVTNYATKEDVTNVQKDITEINNLMVRVAVLSQDEYDAITDKDNNTIYLIK